MTVRIYTRVSSPRAAQEGFSLAAQRDRLERFCDYKGWTDRQVYTDGGISGRTFERPGIEALLEDLRQGDIVLVYALSRFGRGGAGKTLQLLEDVKAAGARLVSETENIDTDTPTGKLMLTILAAIAELELEITLERANMGRLEAAKSGHYPVGILPYGYIRNVETRAVIPHPEHAAVVRTIFELAPKMSLPEIMHELERRGVPSPKNTKWSTPHLSLMLRNTAYHGIAMYFKSDAKRNLQPREQIPILVPALVTLEEWNAAQRAPGHMKGSVRSPDRYPLTGHLKCACGATITGFTRWRKSKSKTLPIKRWNHDLYGCPPNIRHTKSCAVFGNAAPKFAPDQLHDQARALLARVLNDPTDPLHATIEKSSRATPDIYALERARIEARRANLLEMREYGEINREQFLERTTMLEKRLAELRPTTEPEIVTAHPNLARAVLESTNEELAEILDLLEVKYQIVALPGDRVDTREIRSNVDLKLIQFKPLSENSALIAV